MTQFLSVKQWCSDTCPGPLELIVGLCIFYVAAAGGAISGAASTSQAILLVISIVYVRSWPSLWRQLNPEERLLLLGLGLYFFSAVISYANVSDEHEYVKHLGKYVRFLLLVPIYLLLSRADLKLFKYLLAGAMVSGPLYLSIALVSISERPGQPAGGGYHHITFGDMAMLGAMFMITVLVLMKTNKVMRIALVISIACLLYASILSTARGAWLAMPFSLSVLLAVGVHYGKIKIRTIFIVLLVLGLAVAVSPAKNIISSRVHEVADNIEKFQSGEKHSTSVGTRFVMWHVAVNTWIKHPVIGTGPGDFSLEMQASNDEGLYDINFAQSSAHNIYFQALATTGAVGIVILSFALFIMPFRFFYKKNQAGLNVAAVSGMVTLTAFAVFGLTESWTLRAPVISVFLLYFAALATSVSKERGV